MKTLNGQELELFRAGDYGAKGLYTAADLQQLAADYDPAKHEVPLCIGHPRLNAPAFGWLKKLRASGERLFGTFGQVVPAFDQAVQDGLYKKRSVALARHPDGRLDLRHVGYLGAALPEIRGLADATFSGEPFEEIEFSFETTREVSQGEVDMADEAQQKQSILAALKEFFAGRDGKTVDIPANDITALEARLESKFSAALAAKDAKIASLEATFAAHQGTTATAATERRIDSIIAGLRANRHWVPAFDRMGAPAIFAALAASPAQEIEFSDGAIVTKVDPVAAFARFLEGLNKLVPEGVVFAEGDKTRTVVSVQDSAGPVDPASVAFDGRVKAFAAEMKVTYVEAYRTLQAQGDGAVAGAATAGAV